MTAFHPGAAPLGSMFARTSYAAFPVWKDSTQADVKYAPMAKRDAVKIWHHARRFERSTRGGGGQGCARSVNGVISRVGLAVLQAFLFDFLNYRSGRLDPSYGSIAEKAGVSISSVYRSLVRLKAAGILNWIRRKSCSKIDGRYVVEQESNAYGICPPTQWRGYHAPPPAPPPDSWGKPAPVGVVGYLPADPSGRIQEAANALPDDLAAAVAKFHKRRDG